MNYFKMIEKDSHKQLYRGLELEIGPVRLSEMTNNLGRTRGVGTGPVGTAKARPIFSQINF